MAETVGCPTWTAATISPAFTGPARHRSRGLRVTMAGFSGGHVDTGRRRHLGCERGDLGAREVAPPAGGHLGAPGAAEPGAARLACRATATARGSYPCSVIAAGRRSVRRCWGDLRRPSRTARRSGADRAPPRRLPRELCARQVRGPLGVCVDLGQMPLDYGVGSAPVSSAGWPAATHPCWTPARPPRCDRPACLIDRRNVLRHARPGRGAHVPAAG